MQHWLRCVTEEGGQKILKDIHEGNYGSHEGAQTVVQKVFRQVYYWPMIM